MIWKNFNWTNFKRNNPHYLALPFLILVIPGLALPQGWIVAHYWLLIHSLLIVAVARMWFTCSQHERGRLVKIGMFFGIWGLLLVSPFFYTNDGLFQLAQVIRYYCFIPFLFFLIGYLLHRHSFWFLYLCFLLNGAINVLFMYKTIQHSGEVYEAMGGKARRIFIHFLDPDGMMYGPGVLGSCAAGIVCLFFFFHFRSLVMKMVCLAAGGSYLAIGIMSGTRGGALASLFLFVLACGFALVFQQGRAKNLVLGACTLALIPFAFSALADRVPQHFLDRFHLQSLEDTTFTGRTAIWQEAISEIRDNPLGYGLNIGVRGEHSSHNNFLEIFATFGSLAGLFFTITVIGFTGWTLMQMFGPQRRNPLFLGLAAVIGLGLIVSQIEAFILSGRQMFYIVMICSGMMVCEVEKWRRSIRKVPPLLSSPQSEPSSDGGRPRGTLLRPT